MSFKRFFSGVLSLALVLGLSVSARAKGVDRSLLSISGGGSHSACVTQEGQVYAWGSNRALQLGIEDQVDSAAPTEVDGVHAISVACGYDFTAALSFGGTVYTWGFQQDRLPRELSLTGVTKIDAGQTDILALRTDGTVWQWAYGGEPRRVAGLSRVADISAGGGHCLALTVDGCVYAWGGNDYGQLGDGTTTSRQTPVKLPLMNIVDVSAGFSHSLAVSYDGRTYAWGGNDYGQLGDGTREPRFAPVRVKNLSGAVRVAAGNGCSMALNDAGSVYTWGYGEYGQLGNGTNTVAADSPIKVAGLSDVAQIECGVYHCMAVTNGGVLYMWGRNRDGQVWSDLSGSCTTPRKLRGELDTDSAVQLNPVSGASAWAEAELSELYETDAAFPMLWDRFGARITRAEFTALLVSVYESRKSTTVHESATAKFTDVAGHPLESELRKAITLGLVNGTSDTTIEPDRALTRQEGAKILCSFISRTQGVTIPKKLQNLSFYADATLIQPWAAPYVYYAYENKIMRGRTDGCFDPNGGLTREQSLLMAQRVLAMYGSK
jgi:alpha-tubulin suppressor-like RCC1 family protein